MTRAWTNRVSQRLLGKKERVVHQTAVLLCRSRCGYCAQQNNPYSSTTLVVLLIGSHRIPSTPIQSLERCAIWEDEAEVRLL